MRLEKKKCSSWSNSFLGTCTTRRHGALGRSCERARTLDSSLIGRTGGDLWNQGSEVSEKFGDAVCFFYRCYFFSFLFSVCVHQEKDLFD